MHCSSYSCRERYKHQTNFTHLFFVLPGHVLVSCSVFTVTFFLFVVDIIGTQDITLESLQLNLYTKTTADNGIIFKRKLSKLKNSLLLILQLSVVSNVAINSSYPGFISFSCPTAMSRCVMCSIYRISIFSPLNFVSCPHI